MQNYNYTQNDFSYGEISPKSTGYIGTTFMQSSLKKSRGFISLPTGGVMRVPGSKYIEHAHTTGDCRMETITISYNNKERIFIFEFYNLYLRILELGTDYNLNQVIGVQEQNELFTTEELPEICIASNKGTLYAAHKNHNLVAYTFNGTTFIRTNPFSDKDYFNTPNDVPSLVAFKGGRMILASTNNNPNTIWQSRTPDGGDRYFDFTYYDYSTTVTTIVKGGELTTTGGATKNITTEYTTYSTGADSECSKTEIYVVRTSTTSGTETTTITNTYTITKSGKTEDDLTIDKVTQETYTIVSDGSETTEDFLYNEFSTFDYSILPTITTTSTEESTNVEKTVNSSHAIETQETDMYGSRIQWLAPMGRLAVGTSKSIFIDDGSIATPSTFDLSVSVYQGIAKAKNKSIRNYNIFLGTNKKTIYISYYSDSSESLVINELSVNARHLIRSGIKDFDVMFEPYPIIWIVTEDGELVSCLLNFTSSGIISSWSAHPTQSNRKYVAVCASGINGNVLYLNIENTYDSGIENTVEAIELLEDIDEDTSYFMDQYTEINSDTEITEVTGLIYKDGTELEVIADNRLLEKKICYNGSITVLNPAKNFKIGLPKYSYLEFFNPILSSNGVSILTKHSIIKLYLRLYKSGVGKIASGSGSNIPILYKSYGEAIMGEEIELQTKDVEVNAPSTNDVENSLQIIVDEPFPFNLLAISYKYRITED